MRRAVRAAARRGPAGPARTRERRKRHSPPRASLPPHGHASGQRGGSVMKTPAIVSPREWRAAHEKLLAKEKELTRARDALAAERRRMPWMAVEKEYRFEGLHGQ